MGSWKGYEPFADREEVIRFDDALVREHGLDAWAEAFRLGTAGYRDLLNPEDYADMGVPFNALTMALISEATASLRQPGEGVHLGGEVRPWTAEFLDLAARIYAAHGVEVHLRGDADAEGIISTTPIWMSSFGVFHRRLAAGENFTASHSQCFKGGRKPMDGRGMQLLAEATLVESGVRDLVRRALDGETVEVCLAPAGSPLIRRDFCMIEPYAAYVRTVVPDPLLEGIREAARSGFRVAVSTEGGSMGRTSRALFDALGIPTGPEGVVEYLHFAESPTYHGIGQVDGENHGVDPGKWQVYRGIGARELLLSGRASAVFIWDPDGDRFNMVTAAPVELAGKARWNGLEVEDGDETRCLVYFRPNQIYFLLLALRLEDLQERNLLEEGSWLLMETYPTSRSLMELAERFGVPTFLTPVGFKYFGDACASLEDQMAQGKTRLELRDARGGLHVFPAPAKVLLMAEESGGAAMGGLEPLRDEGGAHPMLALKEKDAFQVGLLALALAARLHLEGGSFAGFFLERLDRYGIRHRYYERRDITLFDESLRGEARRAAMAEGIRKRDEAVAFFRSLADGVCEGRLNPGKVTRILQERLRVDCVFPPVQDICWAGDGTLIVFEDTWWQLRASGTDAVLRYYAEGRLREEVRLLNEALVRLDVTARGD